MDSQAQSPQSQEPNQQPYGTLPKKDAPPWIWVLAGMFLMFVVLWGLGLLRIGTPNVSAPGATSVPAIIAEVSSPTPEAVSTPSPLVKDGLVPSCNEMRKMEQSASDAQLIRYFSDQLGKQFGLAPYTVEDVKRFSDSRLTFVTTSAHPLVGELFAPGEVEYIAHLTNAPLERFDSTCDYRLGLRSEAEALTLDVGATITSFPGRLRAVTWDSYTLYLIIDDVTLSP